MAYTNQSTAGLGEADRTRDTARVQSEIKRIQEIVANIGESVFGCNSTLWGPSPDKDPPSTPKPVPMGFFGETLDQLITLRDHAERIHQAAVRLRNL